MLPVCENTPNHALNCGEHACDFYCKVFNGSDLLDDSLKERRIQRCTEIQDKLREDAQPLTLVTGSGISKPAGMPLWPQLVSRMLGMAFYANPVPAFAGNAAHQELLLGIQRGEIPLLSHVNPLESAQYVAQAANAVTKAPSSINAILRSMIQPIIDGTTSGNQFRKDTVALSDLERAKKSSLAACAYLMKHENGFRRAMTYNYDTLLQEYMIDAFDFPSDKLLTLVDCSHADNLTAERRVFHLHGCIPRTGIPDSNVYGHPSKEIILSEDSYLAVEKYGSYNWFNSVQSYYLNYGSCVFVGFSGTDYNFKRILHQRENVDEPAHYIIAAIDGQYQDIYQNVCKFRKQNNPAKIAEEAKMLLHQVLCSQERYWKDFGFFPIWCSVSEIAELLLSLLPTP